jgi:hypothetical protein
LLVVQICRGLRVQIRKRRSHHREPLRKHLTTLLQHPRDRWQVLIRIPREGRKVPLKKRSELFLGVRGEGEYSRALYSGLARR